MIGYRLLAAAAAIGFVLLSGCASKPIVVHEPVEVVIPEYHYVAVPDLLLKACKVDLSALKSNSDLERVLAEALVCNRQHNADKDAIRALEE